MCISFVSEYIRMELVQRQVAACLIQEMGQMLIRPSQKILFPIQIMNKAEKFWYR
jgi:hypothetical protein